jgi:hypothetical protein
MQEHATNDLDYADRLINEQEAANFLGYSVRALQNWRLRGGGPEYVRVSRRSVRYRRRELIRWADEKLELHTSERALPEEQTPPAEPATSAATTIEAKRQAARQPAPVARQTAPAPTKVNPAPGTKPAQTRAYEPHQERERNPFDPFNLFKS